MKIVIEYRILIERVSELVREINKDHTIEFIHRLMNKSCICVTVSPFSSPLSPCCVLSHARTHVYSRINNKIIYVNQNLKHTCSIFLRVVGVNVDVVLVGIPSTETS